MQVEPPWCNKKEFVPEISRLALYYRLDQLTEELDAVKKRVDELYPLSQEQQVMRSLPSPEFDSD